MPRFLHGRGLNATPRNASFECKAWKQGPSTLEAAGSLEIADVESMLAELCTIGWSHQSYRISNLGLSPAHP